MNVEHRATLLASPPLLVPRDSSVFAYFGPITYSLSTMLTIEGHAEVTLTAEVGRHHRRLSRWLHANDAHDRVTAVRMIRTHHDTMLCLVEPTPKASA